MKKLPFLTILFWLSIILLYRFAPHFILKEYIQYPLLILLSILLPVSFWLKIQERKRYQSLLFIGIFLFNLSFLFFALAKNYTAQRTLDSASIKGIHPELAEMLTTGETLEKRRLAARFIYLRHAVALPYKSPEGNYILYTPSQSDTDQYRANFIKDTHTDVLRMNATQQMLGAFLYLILHAGLFLILIVFLIVYEYKGAPEK